MRPNKQLNKNKCKFIFLVKFMKKSKFGANFDENPIFWVKCLNLDRGMHLLALVMSDFSNNVLIFTVLIIKNSTFVKVTTKIWLLNEIYQKNKLL